jgi:hypothetical protein
LSIIKVIVLFTKIPTKLRLYFSECSTIFYTFYKFQQIGYTIEDALLRLGPWKELESHRYAPGSRIKPWKDLGLRNSSGRRGSGQRRRTGGAPGRGRGRGGPHAHLGRVGDRHLCGKVTDDDVRRWSAATAAAAQAPETLGARKLNVPP